MYIDLNATLLFEYNSLLMDLLLEGKIKFESIPFVIRKSSLGYYIYGARIARYDPSAYEQFKAQLNEDYANMLAFEKPLMYNFMRTTFGEEWQDDEHKTEPQAPFTEQCRVCKNVKIRKNRAKFS